VEDEAFVGMGATLLNGVVIEKGAFVAAGAVVSENTRIPAGQVLNLLFSLVLESAPGFFVPLPSWGWTADNPIWVSQLQLTYWLL
jgi:hypothetical protein